MSRCCVFIIILIPDDGYNIQLKHARTHRVWKKKLGCRRQLHGICTTLKVLNNLPGLNLFDAR